MSDDLPETAAPGAAWLAVETPHRIHYRHWGNHQGTPCLFLHGGPGSGCPGDIHHLFPPGDWRLFMPDQRGAGGSEPGGCLTDNDTWALLRDIEALRQHLGIRRWLVVGGSWGATLALLYAQYHPERVLGLLLRGVFLARSRDLSWFFGDRGVAGIYPEAYRSFLEPLTATRRDLPVIGYLELLTGADPGRAAEAAWRWYCWEATVVNGQPPARSSADTASLLRRARIAAHYAAHGFWLDGRGALPEPGRLAAIPAIAVHGRRDLVTPAVNALDLQRAWPALDLRIIPEAGHTLGNDALRAGFVEALEQLRGRLPAETAGG